MKERRNLFPNPRFSMRGTRPLWLPDAAKHFVAWDGVDQMGVVRSSADDGAQVAMWPIKLEPGQKYHFQCYVWHTLACRGVTLYTSSSGQKYGTTVLDDGVKEKRNVELMSADFTVTEAEPWLMIGFNSTETGAAGSSDVHYRRPLLELSSTYDAAVNAGGGIPVYFDYGTLPE